VGTRKPQDAATLQAGPSAPVACPSRAALAAPDQQQDAGLGGAAGWRAEHGGLGAGGQVL